MRLLVAEDEKRLNKIICEALEDEGYSVDACFDGEQALEYARAAEYDAMVMDIMMPRLDGLEAVRQMRSERICAPVLFLTARDSIADRVEGLESGGDYYLVKPFHFPELLPILLAVTIGGGWPSSAPSPASTPATAPTFSQPPTSRWTPRPKP